MSRDAGTRAYQAGTIYMPRLEALWQLQEIDLAIDARRAALDDARARLGDSEELTAARALLSERTAAHREAAATQKDIELQADEVKAKIAPAEEKLYGGSIRNPRELSDLQKDIDQLKHQLSAIEDRDIEALARLETSESEMREAEASVRTLEAAWQEAQAELTQRVQRLDEELAGLEKERAAQAEGIDAAMKSAYDHVRRVRQGRGVARLDRNLCLGCRITTPTAIVNRARSAVGFVQCPNCERILYA